MSNANEETVDGNLNDVATSTGSNGLGPLALSDKKGESKSADGGFGGELRKSKPKFKHLDSNSQLHVKTMAPPSEYYDDSEQPIYHQADQSDQIKRPAGAGVGSTSEGGAVYACSHCWNRKMDAKSLNDVVGVKDVCRNKRLWRMLLAEFVGTLLLVFIGCGSCLNWASGNQPPVIGWDQPTTVQIALTFGLAVATIAQVI